MAARERAGLIRARTPAPAPEGDLSRAWLAAVLRGDAPGWPAGCGGSEDGTLWRTGLAHGVLPLVRHLLRGTPAWSTVPSRFRRRLDAFARRQAALEMLERDALGRAHRVLERAGHSPLLIKGVPLAYRLYPAPYLRCRCDTDVLFPDRPAVDRALAALRGIGYETSAAVDGDLAAHAVACRLRVRPGVAHHLDLHWRACSPHYLARGLAYADLARGAEAVAGVPASARGPGPVAALMLACAHRAAHARFGDENRLIWLYDLHLLAGVLSPRGWDDLASAAERGGLAGVCSDGLEASRRELGTALPPRATSRLAAAAGREPYGPGTARRGWRMEIANLRALPWPARLRLVREHLFPGAEYMLARHRSRRRAFLPLYYLSRIVGGAPKLFH